MSLLFFILKEDVKLSMIFFSLLSACYEIKEIIPKVSEIYLFNFWTDETKQSKIFLLVSFDETITVWGHCKSKSIKYKIFKMNRKKIQTCFKY